MTCLPSAAFSIPETLATQQANKLVRIQYKAQQGDANAQYLLGLMNITGRFVAKDLAQGQHWLETAASQQHLKAMQTLADLSYEGKLYPRNLAQAQKWYQQLSEQGSKWAHFRLGFIYSAGGDGIERHCGKAMAEFSAVGDDVSLGNVAWILATCPEAKFRDGDRAVDMSLKLLKSNQDDPTILDNLAAGYAEQGHFEQAVDTQKKAINALKLAPNLANIDEFQSRLEQYLNQQAYREVIPILE
ncbi:sel1 repeat family protein [Shewanella intestini]|uniref:Sel1 repeat family protein n=1 Tax=Shewanella intestini TaxID=2017544 RepID=A0ABS5I105_9GAMM|nr:sel1 repeat family protein [Shewanella intestini]